MWLPLEVSKVATKKAAEREEKERQAGTAWESPDALPSPTTSPTHLASLSTACVPSA
jgi:hypothetical protein